MLTRKLPLAAFLAATLVAASSHACGPFFPNYLLADRQANLLYLPEGSFALESSRLVLADPRLPQWRDTSADKPAAPTAQDLLLKDPRQRFVSRRGKNGRRSPDRQPPVLARRSGIY